MMHIGITGSRNGATNAQLRAFQQELAVLLDANDEITLHAGCCIGADDEVTALAKLAFDGIRVVGHPPIKKGLMSELTHYDELYRPEDYLLRNQRIVNLSERVYAFPKTNTESRRSGTWYTIRYAIRTSTPVTVIKTDGTSETHKPTQEGLK